MKMAGRLRRYDPWSWRSVTHRGITASWQGWSCPDRLCGGCDGCDPGGSESAAIEAIDIALDTRAEHRSVLAQLEGLGPDACPDLAATLWWLERLLERDTADAWADLQPLLEPEW